MKRTPWSGALAGVLLSLVLAGCAGTPADADAERQPRLGSAALAEEAREVADLLAYQRRFLALPATVQLREFQEVQARHEQQPGAWQKLRLALLLAMPRTSWRDDARAQQLLATLVERPDQPDGPQRDLALLLQRWIADRQLLLREEQRRLESANQRLQAQLAERQRQLQEEHLKVEALEKKIDALRELDRKALQRPGRP